MEAQLKNCTNCKHHKGYSIDDVANECFPCVYHEKKLGYYPNWQAKADPLWPEVPVTEEEEDFFNEAGWQGKQYTYAPIVKQDNVNSPKHYTTGGIETIDYIRAKLGHWGTINYCMGNVIKYTSRWQDKNGKEDLKKAQWYLNYAVKMMEEKNNAHQ